MNYIRGAVNVISAPYQYYKDINPSTLTGAIDVIVIQRPTDSGDTELACSPFHVRFGKWQVLRPSEKKVNVFVNGNPIPFNMKIGEAGEAFFVFETDDDVPADLITSPILQPTISDDAQDSLSTSNIPLLNPPLAQTQSAGHSSYSSSPYLSPSPSPSPSSSPPSSSYLPFDRATSEPPPDTNTVSDTIPLPSIPQRQEYSWEWGAFPQPSTIKPSSSKPSATTTAKKFAKTLRLTSDQLKSLNLQPGANTITFSLSATGVAAATARIFVWDSTDLVVVSDIDGTITKSDGLGHIFAMIGRDWTHVGVAKLYTDIVRNGYKLMYLTSRAIGQADATRDYLKGIKQNNYQLPEGPVIMSPDRLMASLHREVIMRKPEMFKMACLRDIQRIFGESARNPFYAGFGNRITDALSYRSVNVPSARIFTIDASGEVKMELLELAGYKSSYIHMTDLVDQTFPPIHRKWTPEFTDFNYWKIPLQEYALPDLSPPSPTLSARSDTSNQSTLARLRNFSLGGNSARGRHMNNGHLSTVETTDHDASLHPYRNSHLRQMSSFEKLSSTLAFMTGINNGDGSRRSVSPELSSYAGSDEEDGDEIELSVDGRPMTKRLRARSVTSMPGTLDQMHFDMEEEEEEHIDHYEDDEESYGYNGDENDVEEEVEEEFDDDLLAAGAMRKVPFLYGS